VVIFSLGNLTFSDWPEEAYAKIRLNGANEATLRNLKTGDLYILIGRKGMKPGEAIEIVADKNPEVPGTTQQLTCKKELNGFFPYGRVISPRIGPASHWISFFNELSQRSEEHTSELQSRENIVCRLLL